MHYIKYNGTWKPIVNFYQKQNGGWNILETTYIENYISNNEIYFAEEITEEHTLYIGGLTNISGETCSFTAIYDSMQNVTEHATWSIFYGSEYATINSLTGEVTILSNANDSYVIINATYSTYTSTKEITLTYLQGTTSETTTETVTDESGNTTTTTETITINGDGSTASTSTTTAFDNSGNTIGSSENTTQTNADGSFSGHTTYFNENGNAVSGTNENGDTDGNVDTQNLEYDESGNTTVVGYTIDTSNNPNGSKPLNENIVNTEYYAFDLTHGFECMIYFKFYNNEQPPGQHENHHNVLTMKRTSPSPWYGFHIRASSGGNQLSLGTQFATGSNTNTNIPLASNGIYKLKITYNPTVPANTTTFTCVNMLAGTTVYTSKLKFPDIEELKYLKVVIGCALNEDGTPYRFSKIDVYDFSITRI